MSQPHPPRPEDQPAQQPSHPQGPPTQEIPIVAPEAPVEAPAGPGRGPAFSTEAGWHPGGAHSALPAPAPEPEPMTAPPPPVPPAHMSPPPFRPQPVPPEQAWPQPAAPQEPAPADDAAWSARPTGPVDFVPGFGTPAASHPAAGSTAAPTTGQLPAAAPGTAPETGPGRPAKRLGARLSGGAARYPAVFAGLGLGVVGLVLLELGLARHFGNDSLWSVVPTWSAFATVAAVVALLPLVARWVPRAPGAGTTWRIGLAGVAALAAFWVLVALPLVASDRGFLLTAGLGLAAAALWLAPGRAEAGSGSGPGTTA